MSLLKPYFHFNKHIEAGIDEAGCGCLAGPVFAAAVILPLDFDDGRIRDSKKLSERTRTILAEVIKKESIAYGIEMIPTNVIDSINILNARIKAMHMALSRLHIKPEFIIIDGDKFIEYEDIPYTCIIKGDNKFYSIAAASILAKNARDEFMKKLDMVYPNYDWKNNKGYGTKKHISAIYEFGITEHHRKSYEPIRSILKYR